MSKQIFTVLTAILISTAVFAADDSDPSPVSASASQAIIQFSADGSKATVTFPDGTTQEYSVEGFPGWMPTEYNGLPALKSN